MEFDRHTRVLLVRPADAPELTEEEALRLQDAHLAGRLGVEVLTWMIPAGNVSFEQVTRPRSTAEASS